MFVKPFGFGVNAPYLLDLFPSSNVAFSLRKLRNNYTGPCIRVTRTSDNATKDIFFGSYTIDVDDLLSFVGASDGRVNIWYDQSGNGFDVSESTVANQPLIVESGNLVLRQGLPAIRFIRANTLRLSRTTASDILRNSPGIGFFTVSECTSGGTVNGQIAVVRQNAAGTRAAVSMRQSASRLGFTFGGRRVNTDTFTAIGSNPYTSERIIGTVTGDYVAQDIFLFQNGVPSGENLTFTTTGNTGDTQQQFYIGNFNLTTDLYDGFISEVLLWPADQSNNRLRIEQNINSYYQIYNAVGVTDTDAEAFIGAAGITNPIQQLAINNLVIDLKEAGLWTKMDAVYPFVGGTATTHKYNLKNPQDTDAAYRMGFLGGGWTHNSNGITGDGTASYAETYMNASTQLNGGSAQNDAHAFLYLRSTSARAGADMGCSLASPAQAFNMNSRNASNLGGRACMTADVTTTFSTTATAGVFGMSRTNSSNYIHFIDKTQTTVTQASATPPNYNILLQAQNRGGIIQNFQNRNVALFTLGAGLTSGEIDTLVDINQTYQTTLNRFVVV